MKNQKFEEIQTLARYCVTKSPGFAAIALWVPYQVVEEGPFVAYTDGREVFFGEKFWKYEPLERAFIFVHEILHVALRHVARAQKITRHSQANALVWNVATDAVINRALSEMDWLQTPKTGIFFEDLLNPGELEKSPASLWSSEALYLELLKKIELPHSGDDLAEWVRAWMRKSGIAEENLDLRPDEAAQGEDLSEDVASRIWSSRLLRAEASDRAGGLLRELRHDFPVAKTPWPQILRAFLQDATLPRSRENWSRPGRRTLALGSEIFEPSTMRERGIRKVAVAIDTSGSVDDEMLKRFATEIAGVQARTGCEILLLCADSEVQSQQLVKNDGRSVVEKFADGAIAFRSGSGGTAFGPAIAQINKDNATVGLYLTDMQGEFGTEKPKMPFLWCSTTPNQSAPFGKVIYLDPVER